MYLTISAPFLWHQYFNKWAFVYVGLYGFSFMESGKNVMALFHSRCVMMLFCRNFLIFSRAIVQLLSLFHE
jgi:hypothetical protein